MSRLIVIGIINSTPDSFSDGGKYNTIQGAIDHGLKLFEQGANYVELGGDSTRPGSECVGVDVEWDRIKGIIPELLKYGKVAVDTHHLDVAKRALDLGVTMINDISGAKDREIYELSRHYQAKLVVMYSTSGIPHKFIEPEIDPITEIHRFFRSKISENILPNEDLILDPGIGAFISKNPAYSQIILDRYSEFTKYNHPLYLAVSRKGFIGQGISIEEKDKISAEIAKSIYQKVNGVVDLYVRTHDVEQIFLYQPKGP